MKIVEFYRKSTLILLLFGIIFSTYCQESVLKDYYNPNIIGASPEASSFGLYVEQPVDYFTGIPKIEMPIYQIKSKDIEVPVFLSYHASGIKVKSMATFVGLGWVLNTGGIITREVRGLPDDQYDSPVVQPGGSCCAEASSPGAGYLYSGVDIETAYNSKANTYFKEVSAGAKDGMPDIFYFTFGKYSGKFVFNSSGIPQLIPQQNIILNVNRPTGREIESFTATTPEGVCYTFAKKETTYQCLLTYNVEFTDDLSDIDMYRNWYSKIFFGVFSGPNVTYSPQETPFLTHQTIFTSSWYLTKIESNASKEVIIYNYNYEKLLIRGYNGEDYLKSPHETRTYFWRYLSSSSAFIESPVISEISWSMGRLAFRYSSLKREDTEYDGIYHPYTNSVLENITLYDNNYNRIKNFHLITSYFQSTLPDLNNLTELKLNGDFSNLERILSKRLRLDELIEEGRTENDKKPPFIFNYNNTPLPHRESLETDYWGYYNKSNNADAKPSFYEYPDEIINEDTYHTCLYSFYSRNNHIGREVFHPYGNRNPDSEGMKAGVLEEIIVPTGGRKKFFYEPHEFFIDNQKITGGGIRISKIIISEDASYDENRDIVKTYDYNNSGVVNDLPQFVSNKNHIFSENIGRLEISNGSYVFYSEVIENIKNNGNITRIYETGPTYGIKNYDILSNNSYLYNRVIQQYHYGVWPSHFDNNFDYNNIPSATLPNYDWKRGLLKEEKYYSSSGQIIKSIINQYTIKDYKIIPHYEARLLVGGLCEPQFISFEDGILNGLFSWTEYNYSYAFGYSISPWIELENTVVIDYSIEDPTKSMSTTTNYTYNIPRQVSSVSKIQSDGSNRKVTYKYPGEFLGNLVQKSMAMPFRNMVNYPIETVNYKNGKVIGSKITSYLCKDCNYNPANGGILTDGVIVPSEIFGLEADRSLIDYQDLSSTLTPDSRCKSKVVYDSYDNKGNLLQFHNPDNINTSFIWGYNQTYPVTKIENASLEEVQTALGGTIPDLGAGGLNAVQITSLRSGLPKAIVMTFTYSPVIGMTSQTDSNGSTTYYEYDSFGRLKLVKDNDGNILKTYDYHYKQ